MPKVFKIRRLVDFNKLGDFSFWAKASVYISEICMTLKAATISANVWDLYDSASEVNWKIGGLMTALIIFCEPPANGGAVRLFCRFTVTPYWLLRNNHNN